MAKLNTKIVMLKGEQGKDGTTIKSVEKSASSGIVDTYTITLTNGSKFSFNVTNGKGISSISKTGTSGLVDTYTITYNDGTTSTFTVTNGEGVQNLQLVGVGNQDLKNIRFTVRDHYDNEEILFKCDLDDHITLVDHNKETDTRTYCVRVAPTKTESVSIGRYYYDLELNIEDDIYTLMRGHLDITWQVTRR